MPTDFATAERVPSPFIQLEVLTQPPTEKVHALLREGVELSNAIPYGTELEPDSLHERAVTAWTHRVRDALSADYPEWAVPFDNPVGRVASVKLVYEAERVILA